MKRKIFFILSFLLCLTACQSKQDARFFWGSIAPTGISQQVAVRPFRVAMLLPLTGKMESVGQAFQKSAMLALQEYQDSPMQLLFFDTKGTISGTEQAWEEAKVQNPDLVLGPVLSGEVEALSEQGVNVPTISFTTDNSVVSDNIYTFGVLIPSQIERLVQHMCETGHQKLAVIGPENKTGELVMNSLIETVERCPNMTLGEISLYPPETTNFNSAVLKIVPKPIDPKKKNLTEEEKILLETPIEERLDFDSLFVFEDNGVKLRQVISLLSYYDVTPKVVPVYGLANWQGVNDRNLVGGYYAGLPVDRLSGYNKNYQKVFKEKPPRISTLAYDIVSIIARLSEYQAFSVENLQQKRGFSGVDGRVRFNADGTNDRLLEIFQIQSNMMPVSISTVADDFPDKTRFFEYPTPETPEINEILVDSTEDLTYFSEALVSE